MMMPGGESDRKFNIMQIKLIILERLLSPAHRRLNFPHQVGEWISDTNPLGYTSIRVQRRHYSVYIKRRARSCTERVKKTWQKKWNRIRKFSHFWSFILRCHSSPRFPFRVMRMSSLRGRRLGSVVSDTAILPSKESKAQVYLWFICTTKNDNAAKLSALNFAIVSLICSYYLSCSWYFAFHSCCTQLSCVTSWRANKSWNMLPPHTNSLPQRQAVICHPSLTFPAIAE